MKAVRKMEDKEDDEKTTELDLDLAVDQQDHLSHRDSSNVSPGTSKTAIDSLTAFMQNLFDKCSDGGLSGCWKSEYEVMALPNPRAWFSEVFGDENADAAVQEYEAIVPVALEKFTTVLQTFKKRGYTEITANPGSTGLQKKAYKKMTPEARDKYTLFTVRFRKPGQGLGSTLWSFVFVDGGWRIVGKMKAVRKMEDKEDDDDDDKGSGWFGNWLD